MGPTNAHTHCPSYHNQYCHEYNTANTKTPPQQTRSPRQRLCCIQPKKQLPSRHCHRKRHRAISLPRPPLTPATRLVFSAAKACKLKIAIVSCGISTMSLSAAAAADRNLYKKNLASSQQFIAVLVGCFCYCIVIVVVVLIVILFYCDQPTNQTNIYNSSLYELPVKYKSPRQKTEIHSFPHRLCRARPKKPSGRSRVTVCNHRNGTAAFASATTIAAPILATAAISPLHIYLRCRHRQQTRHGSKLSHRYIVPQQMTLRPPPVPLQLRLRLLLQPVDHLPTPVVAGKKCRV